MLSLELKKYRSSNSLSQEELAKLLNISKDKLLKEENHSLVIDKINKDNKIINFVLSFIIKKQIIL